jgi:hypothetical protein
LTVKARRLTMCFGCKSGGADGRQENKEIT